MSLNPNLSFGEGTSEDTSKFEGEQENKKTEFEIVQQLLKDLYSPNKSRVSQAAKKLSHYPYVEVTRTLTEVAAIEIAHLFPNFFIVLDIVKSLENLATPQDIESLQVIKEMITIYIEEDLIRHKNINIESIEAIDLEATRRPSKTSLSSKDVEAKTHLNILKRIDQVIKFARSRRNENLKRLSDISTRPTSTQIVPIQPTSRSKILGDKSLLKDQLLNLLEFKKNTDLREAAKTLIQATSSFLSDEILEQLRKEEHFEFFGRDQEVQQLIDTLTKEKERTPVLLGPSGVGKTSIVQKAAKVILEEDLPAHAIYQKELTNAFIIETTPTRISRLADNPVDKNSLATALEHYFETILYLENKLDLKIILFIDEIHKFNPSQIEAMKPYLDSRTKAIKLIGASTSIEYQNVFKHNPTIQRRFSPIGISEQSPKEVKKIIMASEKPRAERRYGFRITEEVIDAIVQNANKVYPDTSLIDASVKMLMNLCAVEARKLPAERASESVKITEGMVYKLIQSQLGYPVDPLDVKALQKYKEDLLKTLNNQVIGQKQMVKDVTDQWMHLLKFHQKGLKTILILGPTGVGKSHLGRVFAQTVFGSEGAFLEVDGNQFKSGKFSLYTFFGAPNGVLSSDITSGVFFDYLDDPGKGKFGGIILINEAEKAHINFWDRMMEIIDTGRATGNDGKERILNRHLIILTSNRGDLILYPHSIENWTKSEYTAHIESLTEDRLRGIFQEATTGKDQFKLPDSILARIDKYTAAEPILLEKMQMIAAQKAQQMIQQIEKNFKIKIKLHEEVPVEIAKLSYQKGLGARPVEKQVMDLLDSAINRYLVENDTSRGDQLQISLDQSTSSIKIQGPNGQSRYLIPRTEKKDLLSNQGLMNRLSNLDKELKSKIFGQNEMINKIKDAIISHQSTQSRKPLSIFIVGPTGTGKTETAKAIAKSFYRSEDRAVVFDMGKIIHEGELNNIFGSPAEYVGSQEERGFEKFLRENPQGGVIVFDEVSNMGGKDLAQKQALFRKFYSIYEEGTWTSPSTKRTYNLSKYIILNTGNDLEEIFQNISADALRLSIWNKNKSPSKVRSYLLKLGVPEAFLGRMADIILIKPLLTNEMDQITEKILNEQLKEFREKGIEIKFKKDFIRGISNAFFTQDQGARSVRNLIEFRVKSAITQLIIHANGIQNLQGKTISLAIKDNQVNRTYMKPSDPEREVLLKATVQSQGADALNVTLDATEFVSERKLQSKKSILRTAYHEAGHAVVNEPVITGSRVEMVSVTGNDDYLGYTQYENLIEKTSQAPTEKRIVSKIAQLFAGQIAERFAGFEISAGWADDLRRARDLASTYLLEWGLGREMTSIPVNSDGKLLLIPAKEKLFQEEMDRIFHKAKKLAEYILIKKWDLVRTLVKKLYVNGQVTGKQFDKMKVQFDRTHQTHKLSQWVKKQDSSKLVKKMSKTTTAGKATNRCTQLLFNFGQQTKSL